MILLAYVRNDRPLPPAEWEQLCSSVPHDIRQRVSRYRRWQDRQAGLYGKLLLRSVMQTVLGAPIGLEHLAYDRFQRPAMAERKEFDFNISHTDGLVACGGARGVGRIGVDVERRSAVRLDEFRRVFTGPEYERLRRSNRLIQDFYHLWTRKEAVMKADGRGFHLDPAKIDARNEPIVIDGNGYAVRSFELTPIHACHLAAGRMAEVAVHEFVVGEWLDR